MAVLGLLCAFAGRSGRSRVHWSRGGPGGDGGTSRSAPLCRLAGQKTVSVAPKRPLRATTSGGRFAPNQQLPGPLTHVSRAPMMSTDGTSRAYHFLRPHSSGVGPFLQNIAENSNFAKRPRSETVFRPQPLGDNARNLARKLRTPCPEVPSKSCALSQRNRHRAIQALRSKKSAKKLFILQNPTLRDYSCSTVEHLP